MRARYIGHNLKNIGIIQNQVYNIRPHPTNPERWYCVEGGNKIYYDGTYSSGIVKGNFILLKVNEEELYY